MVSQTQGYIHDGYTISGYIKEEKRLYPSLRFTFRPLLAADRAIIFRTIARADDPRKEETIAADTIRGHLVDWTLKDEKGKLVEIKTKHILRVQPRLLTRLFQVITGDIPSDEDPDAISSERDASAEQELKAALSGQQPEEAEAKN